MLISELNLLSGPYTGFGEEKSLIGITDDLVDKVLFKGLEDRGENADCIIVLGSTKASQYRIPVAAAAYHAKRAAKILLSGGKERDFEEGRMCEARHMFQAAIKLGVRPEDLILETFSQNTVENMFGLLLLLQRTFQINRVKRVLLVTTTFHMRRSLALARYLFPDHIEVFPCPADDRNTRCDNWMNSENGRKRALDEVRNIINAVKNGLFPDFEV